MTKKEAQPVEIPEVGRKALVAMSLQTNKTLLVIVGPTAVGKTNISIDVAKRLRTSIVSADSRQCYKGMRIGTAQPTEDELRQAPHYFINAFEVTEHISAARYEELALGYVEALFATNDIVVACGGTGLYIKALCEGLDEMPEVPAEIVEDVERQYKQSGILYLQDAVCKEDPTFFDKGEIQNPARLMRALSFVRATGESILSYRKGLKKERGFRIIKVGLELPRAVLYGRIERRVDNMIEMGLIEEVKGLREYQHLKNLQTVGYTELFDYLNGNSSLVESIALIKQHTRNYAKRQMTWFKKDNEVHWLQADNNAVVERIVELAERKNL